MNIELVKKLIYDWKEGEISSYSAMVALDMIVNPVEVSEEDLEWARKAFLKYEEEK